IPRKPRTPSALMHVSPTCSSPMSQTRLVSTRGLQFPTPRGIHLETRDDYSRARARLVTTARRRVARHPPRKQRILLWKQAPRWLSCSHPVVVTELRRPQDSRDI